MFGLTYSDLEARLKQARGRTGENPKLKAVSAKCPDIEEASFVDSVNKSLRNGDFLLAIAGDGAAPRVNTDRRIRYDDVMAFKNRVDADRRAALEELAVLGQEM